MLFEREDNARDAPLYMPTNSDSTWRVEEAASLESWGELRGRAPSSESILCSLKSREHARACWLHF